jgi:hypothetical protein
MKYTTMLVLLLSLAGCSGGSFPVHAASTLQQQIAAGGTIALPAGTIEIDCASQLVISKTTAIIGAGRDLTILHDACPNGDTLFVDLTQPANVRIEELAIVHDGGNSAVHLIGGNHGYVAVIKRILRLSNVELSGATNCLVSDGLNQLFVEKSNLLHCSQDGAQIGSFGVTLHDNWFGENGRNGATFVDSSVTDELGVHFAGFCASCSGNEYWHNKAHGLVYSVTGIADARHIGDYVDSNGDVGMVVHGVRDFTFNSGWIGSNQVGGAVIDDTQIGTDIVGNTFTTNFGPNLVVTETSGPLHVSGNVSSLPQNPCDARINGTCIDMNTL